MLIDFVELKLFVCSEEEEWVLPEYYDWGLPHDILAFWHHHFPLL
jgi:hypothetical protein